MIYQVDTEKQHLVTGAGHNYAWTNCYLVECSGDEDAQHCMMTIIDIEANILPIDTSIRFACWRPGIGGPVPAGVQLIGQAGRLAAPTAYRGWFDTVRINGYGGRRLLWYKRWRGPLRDIDATGELLTNTYRTLVTEQYVRPLRHTVPLVTRSGGAVDVWYVDPRVAMWQRRDGTERNIRSVLAG